MLRPQPLDAGPATVATSRSFDRTGRNSVERKAIARVQREIAAMPASLVVQLALWPDEIAAWARAEQTSESLVYNMLARRKPYLRMRERLADRLEVSAAILAHLIDARRPLPWAKRDPALVEAAGGVAASAPPPIDWRSPPYPLHRDGTNPIARRAVRAVERDIASMPAAAVVGLALWPATLAEWSREQRLKSSVVWATLAGSPSERVRAELARRLDVTRRDLDDLVSAQRATPSARRPPALADAREQSTDYEVGGDDVASSAPPTSEARGAEERSEVATRQRTPPNAPAGRGDVADRRPPRSSDAPRRADDASSTSDDGDAADQLTLGF